MEELALGLFPSKEPYLSLVKEVLDHQGIIYREIDKKGSQRFPCVLVPSGAGKDDDNAFSEAAKHCSDNANIIDVQDTIDLDTIRKGLAGFLEEPFLEGQLLSPIVNQLENKLLDSIKQKYFDQNLPLVRKWYWPRAAKACLVMTHDIDDLNVSFFDTQLYKKPKELFLYFGVRIVGKRPYRNNIQEMLALEKQKGIKSTYYFMSDYGKYQKYLPGILRAVQQNGHELGLHAGLHSAHNPELLTQEKGSLENISGSKIKSVRQHGLNFLPPLTWKYYNQAGLEFDSTFNYNDEIGFRSGICYPYHPFDIMTGTKLEITEIPPVMQDWTGWVKQFEVEDFRKILKKLSGIIERYHGCFTISFHNTFLDNVNYPHILKAYTELLDYVKRKNYWIATTKECGSWWRKRENVQVNAILKKGAIAVRTSESIPIVIEEKDKSSKHIRPTGLI